MELFKQLYYGIIQTAVLWNYSNSCIMELFKQLYYGIPQTSILRNKYYGINQTAVWWISDIWLKTISQQADTVDILYTIYMYTSTYWNCLFRVLSTLLERKMNWWRYCLSLCDEIFDNFSLFDETLRYIEQSNSDMSHTQRNPSKLF